MKTTSDQPAEAFDVVIVGSGPSGSAYARVLHDEAPQLRILMVETGPTLGDRPGLHVKNMPTLQDRSAAQVASQGPAASVSPEAPAPGPGRPGTFLLRPDEPAPWTGMPAAAMSSNVGGMGAHWTCACPRPGGSERIAFLDDGTLDAALSVAERLLAVTADAFEDAPFSAEVRRRLAGEFSRTGAAAVQPMPLAVRKHADGTITWSGTDVVLGPLAEPEAQGDYFELRARTLCQRVMFDGGRVSGVALRDLATGTETVVAAPVVVVAADALRTPQVLFASGIRMRALGRYLNDQPQVISAVRLPSEALEAGLPVFGEAGAAQHSGVSWVPYTDQDPFHGQVMQLDASPVPLAEEDAVIPGSIVGLGWFCATETVEANRVEFEEASLDHYGMPRMTIHYNLTWKDLRVIEAAKDAVTRAGKALGTFLDDRPPFLLPAGSSLHYQGSVRMGQFDDGRSVCGPDSQVWGTEGLYVAGNGVIPTSTACNPTLTSVALAVLGARSIIDRLR
ncbi:GMC oxidoreductase [Arthrobacter sp. HMWF013]|uniref:GMC oxidoreductase n=1 Tax=Arthrobacter sp. HMWF013 TaxID=2056849 RepID=UPI000D348B95|nr:GMC oxidoreductase [Arthrobacter sp. HMWF013]PTT68583.1 choline dehydrogenase [Arthrobacter sp. HMWF013]